MAWRCPDGTQHLFCWPTLAISGQLLASDGPVVDSRDLNLVFGHAGATPNKLFLSNPTKYIVESSWMLVLNPGKHNVVLRTLLESPEVLWNRLQETGNVRRRPGAGRPRTTTSTDDRYIQLTVRRNRTENATQLQRQLLLATGRRVSSQTVRNRLHEGGLYARRPMVCLPLTPCHRAARRRWAAEHRDWEQHDWS
ncbi:transposable element Tcb2 transposase [Trichonephila clavipes]|nr:transposable element Tcb2 transposase [Trichonephila clavipes]